jgi:hypothetical protein
MNPNSPQEVMSHWFRQVDAAREAVEERWAPGTMRTVDYELARKVGEQRRLFTEACVCGTQADIEEHGAAMLRGYEALTEAMEASGEPEDRQAPSLQKLVEEAGGYNKITPRQWEDYDKSLAMWRQRMRAGDFAW